MIFSVFIVQFIMDHFSIRFIFFEGVVAPFIFKVTMFMFALFLWVFMLMLLFHSSGMGWLQAGLSALWLGLRGVTGGEVSAWPVALLEGVLQGGEIIQYRGIYISVRSTVITQAPGICDKLD